MLRKTRVFLSAVIMGTLMISTTACGEVSVETVARQIRQVQRIH